MLRTLVVRGNAGLGLVKKGVRVNAARTLLIQARRGRLHKLQKYSPSAHAKTCISYNQVRFYADYPEHTKVALPALSPTMEEGTLISWAKKEGDKLNEGDLLAEIETDKATMAFETPEEGYLAKILVPAGSKGVPIGKLVCIIVQEEKDIAAFKNYKDDASAPAKVVSATPVPSAAAPAPPAPVAAPPAAAAAAVDAGGRVYASPMAKKLAEQRNIRLQGKGTGLYDSITSADLNKMPAAGQPAAAVSAPRASGAPPSLPGHADIIPVSNMRGVIAKRLLESKQNVPHYYVSVTVNVDKLLALKKKFDKINEKDKIRISINDMVIKATALSSVKVPETNSMWFGDTIKQFKNVDVSVAVATDKGLLTPIVFEANNKGLLQINKELKLLAAKAREGKLQPHEFQGGTISVSNLGMYNIDHFTAIINPPQSCILAVGSTSKQLVLDENAEKGFREASFMTVCLSSDHRIVDGAVAAKWLQHFRMCIEEPETMLL